MKTWKVAVAAPAAAAAAFEAALEPFAVAVSTYEAEPAAAKPRGLPEPATWMGDLWLADACVVEAIADRLPDRTRIETAVAIAAAASGIRAPEVVIEEIADVDWQAQVLASLPAIEVGRFRVRGGHIVEPPRPGVIDLEIEAGAAFGSGEHETTRACLAALGDVLKRARPARVLDLGCGTGVLGLAAAVYGVVAVGAIGGERAYRSSLLGEAPEVALPTEAEVDDKGPMADPEGAAPALTWQITTEDGNPATLRIDPDDAWKGAADAKVAVVEFADLECGYCKRASGQLKRLYEAYGDRVAFVFKHYPMDPACNPGVKNKKHRYACLAAEASVCAQKQGRFWAFHDITFKNQHQLKPDDLRAYAGAAGLDTDAFDQCMRSREGKDAVVADATHGAEVETHGTPRIWIDGKLYRAGTSAEQMARALELALGADAGDAAAAARQLAERRDPIVPVPADVPEMTRIEHDGLSFEIDTFEAGMTDGKATAGKHQVPGLRMSWFAARDACEAAGKRLCTEEEWVTACQGARAVDDDGNGQFADDLIEGRSYPYGEHHDPRRCWDNQGKQRPVYTGEMPGCVSADGVYDLTGNAEEWVGTSPETAVLLGGAFDTSKDFARCYRRNDTFGAGYANPRTGFRCCR